jgi:general secretion pathway protein I
MRLEAAPSPGGGFTLLEVLVAFLIAALALTALYGGVIGGLRSTRVAEAYQEAVARARSHLSVLGREGQLSAQDASGDDGGGYRWHIRVTPVATASAPAEEGLQIGRAARGGTALFAVSVEISWKDGAAQREVRLESQRLGQAPTTAP